MLRVLLALVLALPLLLPVGFCPCRLVEPADAPDDEPCCCETSPTQLKAEQPPPLPDATAVFTPGLVEPPSLRSALPLRPTPRPAGHDPPVYLRFASLTL